MISDEELRIAGQRIRELREKRDISQRALGIKTGIGNSTISRIEAGRVIPQPSTLMLLAKILRCEYTELMNMFGYISSNTDKNDLCDKYNLPDDVHEAIEKLHKDPKLQVLLSKGAKLDQNGIEAVLRIVELMNKEENDIDDR